MALATGGDDYEIVATFPGAPPDGFTVIGEVFDGAGVAVTRRRPDRSASRKAAGATSERNKTVPERGGLGRVPPDRASAPFGTPMAQSVRLLSIATASPPHEITQDQVAQAAQVIFGERFPRFDRMLPVYGNAGVRTRQLVMPVEWYLEPHGWPERATSTWPARWSSSARPPRARSTRPA